MERLGLHLTSSHLERFDGSTWRIFGLSEGFLVVTASGLQLFRENPSLGQTLLYYKNEVLEKEKGHVRKWFQNGSNSDIYSVAGTDLVVKEATTSQSVWSALDRMDCLYSLCETYLPNFIRVTEHYGAVFFRDYQRQFLLMKKVDEGIAVDDINSDTWPNELRVQVNDAYLKARGLIEDAMRRCPLAEECRTNLIPDWQGGNVLVDLSRPSSYYPFTLQIIDQ